MHKDFQLTVRCLGGVFYIRYSPENIAAPLFEKHLKLLEAWHIGDPEGETEIIKPFKHLLESLASGVQGYLLFEYPYAQSCVLEVTTNAGDTKVTPRNEGPGDYLPPGDYLDQVPELGDLGSWVSRIYPSNQVHLPISSDRDARLSGPGKVRVDGVPCFFKKWYYGGGGPGTSLEELRAYKCIQEASASGGLQADLRICRLHGVVIDSDADAELGPTASRIVGILLTHIETHKPRYVGTLAYRVRAGDCATEKLERWASELDSCVKELHRAGIVWGDAKPENVLVDGDDEV